MFNRQLGIEFQKSQGIRVGEKVYRGNILVKKYFGESEDIFKYYIKKLREGRFFFFLFFIGIRGIYE